MTAATTPTAPRCAKCGNEGHGYDPLTETGGALYLTVDCRWRPEAGKWELVERADSGGGAFDCLQCDFRTEAHGPAAAFFPYGEMIAPPGAEKLASAPLPDYSAQMLAMLEMVLDVCDMADPRHENFADSGADCLQVILENEEKIRAIVAKAKGKAA